MPAGVLLDALAAAGERFAGEPDDVERVHHRGGVAEFLDRRGLVADDALAHRLEAHGVRDRHPHGFFLDDFLRLGVELGAFALVGETRGLDDDVVVSRVAPAGEVAAALDRVAGKQVGEEVVGVAVVSAPAEHHRLVFAVLGAFDASVGTFEVSATATAYFHDTEAVSAVRSNADVSLDLALAKDNAGYVIDIPLVSLGGGNAKVEQDKPITVDLSADAAEGEAGHTLLITEFPYLPSLAQ